MQLPTQTRRYDNNNNNWALRRTHDFTMPIEQTANRNWRWTLSRPMWKKEKPREVGKIRMCSRQCDDLTSSFRFESLNIHYLSIIISFNWSNQRHPRHHHLDLLMLAEQLIGKWQHAHTLKWLVALSWFRCLACLNRRYWNIEISWTICKTLSRMTS